nr:MAG TPA: hypothetical protein [Caudoviricetes sp.]
MLKLYYRKIEGNDNLHCGRKAFHFKKSTIQKTPATFFVGLLIFILKKGGSIPPVRLDEVLPCRTFPIFTKQPLILRGLFFYR